MIGKEYEILAIIKNYGVLSYIIYFEIPGNKKCIDFIDPPNCTISCNDVPSDWTEIKYSFLKPLRIRFPSFDFNYRITYFHGPLAILKNEEFLFDIVEDSDKAFDFVSKLRT